MEPSLSPSSIVSIEKVGPNEILYIGRRVANFVETYEFFLFSEAFSRHFLSVSLRQSLVQWTEERKFFIDNISLLDLLSYVLADLFKLGKQVHKDSREYVQQDNQKETKITEWHYELGKVSLRVDSRDDQTWAYVSVFVGQWVDLTKSHWLDFSKLE